MAWLTRKRRQPSTESKLSSVKPLIAADRAELPSDVSIEMHFRSLRLEAQGLRQEYQSRRVSEQPRFFCADG
jgi:hypothetical protein